MTEFLRRVNDQKVDWYLFHREAPRDPLYTYSLDIHIYKETDSIEENVQTLESTCSARLDGVDLQSVIDQGLIFFRALDTDRRCSHCGHPLIIKGSVVQGHAPGKVPRCLYTKWSSRTK